jgi:hypothetical protein
VTDDFVEVYRGSGGQFRAEMLRSLLSGSGIASVIQGGADAGYPVTVGVGAQFKIIVRAEDAERAAELLRAADEEGGEGLEDLDWEAEEGPE